MDQLQKHANLQGPIDYLRKKNIRGRAWRVLEDLQKLFEYNLYIIFQNKKYINDKHYFIILNKIYFF